MPHDGPLPQPDLTPETLVLCNARLILPDETITGGIEITAGRITAIHQGKAVPRGAIDCDGDFLAPGLIELHTDNLERHLQPRPGVHWPPAAAILAHDTELAGLGITTVFDALRVGSLVSADQVGTAKYARDLALEIGRLRESGLLRINHQLHLRAEVCSETLIAELEEFDRVDRVGIVSVMDHTPGQRQFADIEQMRRYYRGKRGYGDADFDRHVEWLRSVSATFGAAHEAAAVRAARRLGAILASHDDTTAEQVARSASNGTRLAEFPTTLVAAQASREAGIAVMMGAPNLLRGGSHSGNVAARDLADAGLLDILSSDYIPAALLMAAVHLGHETDNIAAGLATVTAAPARTVGLADRGRLEPGLRADLVRFRIEERMPVTRAVWVNGVRVT